MTIDFNLKGMKKCMMSGIIPCIMKEGNTVIVIGNDVIKGVAELQRGVSSHSYNIQNPYIDQLSILMSDPITPD
jgi:hypothetical protein